MGAVCECLASLSLDWENRPWNNSWTWPGWTGLSGGGGPMAGFSYIYINIKGWKMWSEWKASCAGVRAAKRPGLPSLHLQMTD